MRLALATIAAAVVAVGAALVIGEQELSGVIPLIAAGFVGFGLAEILAGIGRVRDARVQAVAGLLAAAALAWGDWISLGTGRHAPLGLVAKLAPLVAAAVAVLTVRSSARPAADTPDGS